MAQPHPLARLEAGIEASRQGQSTDPGERLALLRELERLVLPQAQQVLRLHEALCFLRAYPGDAAVLAQVERLLERFARREDLRRHRAALADSGIAGTAIHYRFFAGQAQWLAKRWPRQLVLDRSDGAASANIARALPPLLSAAEADALIELKLDGYAALDRLRGGIGDAAFLLARIAAMPAGSLARETISDGIDASFILEPGPDTPSRTAAFLAGAPRVLSSAPRRGRPDLRAQLQSAPRRIKRLSIEQGRALADLAQAAMITRARSLEAFSYAEPRDAWLVEDRGDGGDGLAFAFIGMQPERRHAIAALYGGLTLRNGVPIGYTQADIVGACAALSFNTFDTFRGGEAAFTFARWLAALKHLFGTTSFTIEPYQLGKDNKEGLESGAWWFYFKLGFAPRDAKVRALARAEVARLEGPGAQRTSAATLLSLAEAHLFFDEDQTRPHPLPQPAALGLAAGAWLSRQSGAEREAAIERVSVALRDACGIALWRGFTRREREAWARLAPVVALLDVGSWASDERRSLAALLRAKGARSERGFIELSIAHPRFEAALLQAGTRAARAVQAPWQRRRALPHAGGPRRAPRRQEFGSE